VFAACVGLAVMVFGGELVFKTVHTYLIDKHRDQQSNGQIDLELTFTGGENSFNY
jgi:hypothetical protein